MERKKSTLARIDMDLKEDMKKVAKTRLDAGLARFNPKEISIVEMTRLLRRTNGYKLSLEELKTKPKKEDLL